MRVLVCGSRTWTDIDAVFGSLDLLADKAHELNEPMVVVHGAAKDGADAMADRWVRERRMLGWPVVAERHPAKWWEYGQGAGKIRNSEMVQLGADACVAFLGPCVKDRCKEPKPHPSHGTVDCAAKAAEAGIPVTPVERWREEPAGVDGGYRDAGEST